MSEKVAGAAFFVAGAMDVSFLYFYPESCMAGHDNKLATADRQHATTLRMLAISTIMGPWIINTPRAAVA
jgi:hypothetical protein